MTINTQTGISDVMLGDGISRVFPFDFKVGSIAEIAALINGAAVPLANFTVSLDEDAPGGSVTFDNAPSVNAKVRIASDPAFVQASVHLRQGPFYPDVVEDDFDLAAVRDIYLKRQIGTTIRAPEGEVVARLASAIDRANKFMAFDSLGNPIAAEGIIDGVPVGAFGASLAATGSSEAARNALGLPIMYAENYPSLEWAFGVAADRGGANLFFDSQPLSVRIEVGEGVNAIGWSGKRRTVLTATTATAGITFPGEQRGGYSGGFEIDGNDVGELLLEIEVSVGRTFGEMKVYQSAGVGAWLKGTQNSLFNCTDFEHCLIDNFIIDLGAGNNLFVKNEYNRGGQRSFSMRQSGVSPAGAFTQGPTSNHWIQPVIERLGWAGISGGIPDLGNPGTADCLAYFGAGSDNLFTSGSYGLADTLSPLTAQKSMFKFVRDNPVYANQGTTFNGIAMQGDPAFTTAFEIGDNTEIILAGQTKFENHLNAFKAGDAASIKLLGTEVYGGVTNEFVNLGAGVKKFEEIARHTLRGRRDYVGTAALAIIETQTVRGEANARKIVYTSADVYGDGATAARAVQSGGMVATIPTMRYTDLVNGDVIASEHGGIMMIFSKVAGPPTYAVPDGSEWRTSFGGGALYRRRAGAWAVVP